MYACWWKYPPVTSLVTYTATIGRGPKEGTARWRWCGSAPNLIIHLWMEQVWCSLNSSKLLYISYNHPLHALGFCFTALNWMTHSMIFLLSAARSLEQEPRNRSLLFCGLAVIVIYQINIRGTNTHNALQVLLQYSPKLFCWKHYVPT